jgi:hypothetical protein
MKWSIKILTFFLFLTTFSFAQEGRHIWNLPKYDRKPIHFGFQVGITSNTLDVKYSDQLLNSSIINVDLQRASGFNVGMISDLRLNKHFNLRFVPTLTLLTRNIQYSYYTDLTKKETATLNKKDEATLLNIPLTLKFRAARRGNVRPYIFSGGQLIFDMTAEKNLEDKEVLNLGSSDFGLHFGAGLDFYLEYFKFGVEARYVYGLSDLRVDNGTDFYNVFESVHHRGFRLVLTFE